METWKDIKGYEGLYQVSDFGRIRSVDRLITTDTGPRKFKGKILNQNVASGYQSVMFSNKGIQKRLLVHRLVAETFINNPENKGQVNHIDGSKLNNHVTNLEWVSQEENVSHSYKIGLRIITNAQMEVLEKGRHNGQAANKKKVSQFNKSGDFICMYSSIAEASKITGVSKASISENVRGRNKTAGGYIWKYAKKDAFLK